MTPLHDCILSGGGSRSEGEITLWNNVDEKITNRVYSRDEKLKSVYAICISPSGNFLAAGSKSGLIRVWPFLDKQLSDENPFLFEIYHQLCPVTALVFLTDDLLLSAGANGKIRVISISQKKYLKDLDAHSGAVCSMIALGSRIVASLGVDGKIKIWDMDSLTCEFQVEGFFFPKSPLNHFPALSYSQATGHLCCPSSQGKLHLFDLQNLCSHEAFLAHQSVFYATAATGKYIATGGMNDGLLKLWDLNNKKSLFEHKSDSSFLRLCSVGGERVAAICSDTDRSQSIRLYTLPELKPSGAVTGLDIRSISSLPLPVFEQRRNIELASLKRDLIEKARAKISSPEHMEPFLDKLAENGFWAEAKLLQAESAKLREKPLHELGFLLQLTNALDLSNTTAPVFHRLALLFEQLNEPGRATEVYERIETFFDRLEETLNRLKAHPLFGIDPKKTARTDISSLELATQEIEKDTVLKRSFCWNIIINSKESQVFKIRTLDNLEVWEEHIGGKTSSIGRDIQMKQEIVTLFGGHEGKRIKWLRISQIGLFCPSEYLDYSIEIDSKNGLARGYGIFNPNKKTDAIENVTVHNAALAQAYRSIYHQREVGIWINRVHDAMQKLDKQASYKGS